MPDATRDEVPSGLPEGDRTEPGPEAMPGIPVDGEPPAAS
jgi:hypothetical protein